MLRISTTYSTIADPENGFSVQPIWRITLDKSGNKSADKSKDKPVGKVRKYLEGLLSGRGICIPRGFASQQVIVETPAAKALPTIETALAEFEEMKAEYTVNQQETFDKLVPSFVWTSHFLKRNADPHVMTDNKTHPDAALDRAQKAYDAMYDNLQEVLGPKKTDKLTHALKRSYSKEVGHELTF